ncbi:extracellular solute-binding protein [Microbispora corallina]|uniref:ABC transporter substrate-binding protein n=1 Tax=Microbispora corallina TaxID=83302 RepID=A0ABQ4FZC9_9ACTN|nr:extracellular solute-binding protein [Microbispora corallina]GIH40186.1 ABC transporter substrate-binding protein [Microbispora corallina]
MSLQRREFLGLGVAAGTAAFLAACGVPGGSSGSGATGPLRALFMKQAGYSESDINAMIGAFKAAYPKVPVEATFVAYEALHDKIVTSAAAGKFDVVLIDGQWLTEFATKKMIIDVTSRFKPDWKTTMLPVEEIVRYQDRDYAMPWVVGGKLFYYNKKLLADNGVAETDMKTWDGVLGAARTLKKKGAVKFPFVWSWAQAECVIVDYGSLLAAFGGRWQDDQGKFVFNTGGGVTALEWMKSTIDEGLTDPSSLKYIEDDVKRVLLQGQAAMVLNWDYVASAAKDPQQSKVVGDIVVTTSPIGPSGAGPACTGSSNLAITTGCERVDDAWNFVTFLASPAQQEAHPDNITPIWADSYSKASVLGDNPELAKAHGEQLKSVTDRPKVNNYNAISQVIQQQIQAALYGQQSPQAALDTAVEKANELATA